MIIKKKTQKNIKNEKKELINNSSDYIEATSETIEPEEFTSQEQEAQKEPEIDLFEIENIDFNQRQERRRGDRKSTRLNSSHAT